MATAVSFTPSASTDARVAAADWRADWRADSGFYTDEELARLLADEEMARGLAGDTSGDHTYALALDQEEKTRAHDRAMALALQEREMEHKVAAERVAQIQEEELLSAAAVPVRGAEVRGAVTAGGAVIDGVEYECEECGGLDNMCFYLSVESGSVERARALKARLAPEANRLSIRRCGPHHAPGAEPTPRAPVDFGAPGIMADEEVFQAAAAAGMSVLVAHHGAGRIRLYAGANRERVGSPTRVHLAGSHFRRLVPKRAQLPAKPKRDVSTEPDGDQSKDIYDVFAP